MQDTGAAGLRKIPLVATFHSKYYDDFYQITRGNDRLASLGVKLVVEFYGHCDEVWAVSQPSAQVLRTYGFKGDIVVMDNGTDLPPLSPQERQQAADLICPQAGEWVLLYVGQMNWKKNIRLTLQVAARLKASGFSFQLVLAGQ